MLETEGQHVLVSLNGMRRRPLNRRHVESERNSARLVICWAEIVSGSTNHGCHKGPETEAQSAQINEILLLACTSKAKGAPASKQPRTENGDSQRLTTNTSRARDPASAVRNYQG